MADEVQTVVNFDHRFARPFQLNRPAIEAAIAACPKILTDVYAAGLIDGMTGYRRPCPASDDPAPASRTTDTAGE